MSFSSEPASGLSWIPKRKAPLLVWSMAGLFAGLSLLSLTAALDLFGVTRSPLCGGRCEDPAIERALSAEPAEFAATYRAARRAVNRQIALSPFDAGAWFRLTLLETKVGDGRLTPVAREAFDTAYERAPVDATLAPWRIPFAFNHWHELSDPTRQAVMDEVRVIHQAPQNRPELRRLVRRIQDFDGGFSYLMLLESLDDQADRPAPRVAPARETPTAQPSDSAQRAPIAGI